MTSSIPPSPPEPTNAPEDEGGLHSPPGLSDWGRAWWWFDFVILVKLARLRIITILVAIGVVITQWDTLVSCYEKWTRPTNAAAAVSSDHEFFCPMHPAVVRDNGREKCPICFMPLSKRKKGESTVEALPAGVVNRVQLSPYSVVLAGVHTSEVEMLPLTKEIDAVGFVEFNKRDLKNVSARVKGRLDELLVNETGQMVASGDILASLYSPDLNVTVQNLLDAKRRNSAELMTSSRQRLQLLGIADDQIDDIVQSVKANSHLRIRSPISGHVIKKYVREGQYVEEGSALYDVADLSSVWIQAQIYENDMVFLPFDQSHKPRVDDPASLALTATTRAFLGESIRRLLISSGSMSAASPMSGSSGGSMTSTGGAMNRPTIGTPPGGGLGTLADATGGEGHSASPGHAIQGRTLIPLSAVAEVKIVEGPAMIKSENGRLLNYVTLNVRGRDIVGFVDEARRVVAEKVTLPEGVHIEWNGEFEHQVRAAQTLRFVFPVVIALIFLILYLTYRDLADAALMMLTVPEALAGGAFFMYLFPKIIHGWDTPPMDFSVAVWVGFIACFGMATETGIIMLVYLREAIEKRGGREKIASLEELRQAVIEGAVHRLRPKLLTEGVAIIAIFPMVFARGIGGEILAPMALPVLGGLLISDEVVDLFLPVRFYWVRRARWLKLHQHSSTAIPGSLHESSLRGCPKSICCLKKGLCHISSKRTDRELQESSHLQFVAVWAV